MCAFAFSSETMRTLNKKTCLSLLQSIVAIFFDMAVFFDINALLNITGIIEELKILLAIVALLYLKFKRPDLKGTIRVRDPIIQRFRQKFAKSGLLFAMLLGCALNCLEQLLLTDPDNFRHLFHCVSHRDDCDRSLCRLVFLCAGKGRESIAIVCFRRQQEIKKA